MGELTARQLLSGGVGSVMVTNRTFDRPSRWRATWRHAVRGTRHRRYLPLADLVIGVASGDGFLLGAPAVEAAVRERRGGRSSSSTWRSRAPSTRRQPARTASTSTTSTTSRASSSTTRGRARARR
jgi:hypothetical protein